MWTSNYTPRDCAFCLMRYWCVISKRSTDFTFHTGSLFILKSILDVFWRISKFISDQPQPIRFGFTSDFRKPVKRPNWHASNCGCFVMMMMMMASPWRTNISITPVNSRFFFCPPPFVKNYILIAISIAFQSFVPPVSLLKPFLIKTCLTLGHELYSVW